MEPTKTYKLVKRDYTTCIGGKNIYGSLDTVCATFTPSTVTVPGSTITSTVAVAASVNNSSLALAVGLPLAALSMIVGVAIVYLIRKRSRKLSTPVTTTSVANNNTTNTVAEQTQIPTQSTEITKTSLDLGMPASYEIAPIPEARVRESLNQNEAEANLEREIALLEKRKKLVELRKQVKELEERSLIGTFTTFFLLLALVGKSSEKFLEAQEKNLLSNFDGGKFEYPTESEKNNE
ncbi:597_t:CDS:2 [Paraglomus occultum]|uniref:597_t:CDS:1 n=1 Tax=Paraglomus occultum TaxID=144539 RepID=A0A9N9BGA2_9GLOM|nr:597_t:CDS:2 [Paraglomus occultum]